MSKIEVNAIEPQCGTTLTLGGSGDTVTLGSGASQSGFGRTGTVDWQTGSIKTATFTAANGEGYFANTSSGGFTMNLPAGSAGAIVSVVDYTNTFQTNALTVAPNGSEKIGGIASSVSLTTEGQSVTFVYVDGTEGWKNIQDSTSNVTGNPFLQATGGTVTTCGNCKIHTFTGPGTFTVNSISSNCASENVVSYLVVAGGGGGGAFYYGGAGGAGGYREVKTPVTPYTASPLDGYPSAPNRITVTAQAYPITVGGGGAGGPGPNGQGTPGVNGSSSVFSTITAAGGGFGGSSCGPGADPISSPTPGADGGSGGGGGGDGGPGPTPSGTGGAGNTPPVTPAQGNNGGIANRTAASGAGGGGGGATAAGANASTNCGGNGGAGATTSINATPTTRAGGGGGGVYNGTKGTAGSGGGGNGGDNSPGTAAQSGTDNTGGGGGGAGSAPSDLNSGGSGGSGIVIIRYKYQ